MKVSIPDPKTYLWQNICLLMKGAPTIDAVQQKTGLGRGTIQRIKEAQTSVGTDVLVSLADAFGIEIPQLLTPGLHMGNEAAPKNTAIVHSSAPTVHSLCVQLAEKLKPLDRATKDVAAAMLKAIAEQPDESAKMINVLASLLGEFETMYPEVRYQQSLGH